MNYFITKEKLEELKEKLPNKELRLLPIENIFLTEFGENTLKQNILFHIPTNEGFLMNTGFRYMKQYYKILVIQKIKEDYYYMIDKVPSSKGLAKVFPVRP